MRARARAGDADAFGAVFDACAKSVYNHAFRLTGDWSAAEEVMAMTFLEAWRSRDRIAPDGGSLRPWLLGIATNVARGQRRAARRYRAALARLAVAGEVPDFAEDVSGRLDDAARIKALHRALAGLPRHELEILALCVWSGLGYAEAAEALNVPVGTVRSRLSRARARLALCRSKIRFGPVTWGFSVDQAACVYSLIRLPRTGLRWIRAVPGPVRAKRVVAGSRSGTCCAVPWCGLAVL